jgi:hypothetical protein
MGEKIMLYYGLELTEEQKRVYEAFLLRRGPYRKLAVPVGHGIGGTTLLAMIALELAYQGSSSYLIAPTSMQVKQIIEPELLKLCNSYEQKRFLEEGVIRLISAYDGLLMPPTSTVILVDQAAHVQGGFLKGLKKHRQFLLGIPSQERSYFNDLWTTEGHGFALMEPISATSPNASLDVSKGRYFDRTPLPYPRLVLAEWINDMIDRYGLDSDYVQRKVFGKVPMEYAEDGPKTDITLAEVEFLKKLIKVSQKIVQEYEGD